MSVLRRADSQGFLLAVRRRWVGVGGRGLGSLATLPLLCCALRLRCCAALEARETTEKGDGAGPAE